MIGTDCPRLKRPGLRAALLLTLSRSMRTLEYDPRQRALLLIDQTRLPHQTVLVPCRSPEDVAYAIKSMQVRGAPAIGAAAAYGMALGAQAEVRDQALTVEDAEDDVRVADVDGQEHAAAAW